MQPSGGNLMVCFLPQMSGHAQTNFFVCWWFHFISIFSMIMSTETIPSWFSLLIMLNNHSCQMKDQAYTLLSQHLKLYTLPGIWDQQNLPGPNSRSHWMLGCSRSLSTMRKQLSQMHTFLQWVLSFFFFLTVLLLIVIVVITYSSWHSTEDEPLQKTLGCSPAGSGTCWGWKDCKFKLNLLVPLS